MILAVKNHGKNNLKPSQAEASSALFLSRKPRSKEAVPAVPRWRVMASPKEEISWGDAKGALEAMPSCKARELLKVKSDVFHSVRSYSHKKVLLFWPFQM